MKKLRILSTIVRPAQGRSRGQIVARHRGGLGFFRRPLTAFDRSSTPLPAYVKSVIKTRAAEPYIALTQYPTGALAYMRLTEGLFIGALTSSVILKTTWSVIALGTFTWITETTQGSAITNLQRRNRTPYPWARAAGTKCIINYLSFNKDFYLISLPSGEHKKVPTTTLVTLGQNSNFFHKKEVIGAAGRSRRLGIRPLVRGVAMNPVDHPHGGRTKTVQPEVSPWGWIAKKNR